MSVYYEHFKLATEKNKSGIDYYGRFKVGKGIAKDDVGAIYRAILHQRGYGARDFDEMNGYGFWQDLWSMGKPLLTKGLKYLGSLGVNTVSNIAHDAMEGKNIKEAAQDRFQEAQDDIVARVPGTVKDIFGDNKSRGYKRRGRKRGANSRQSAGAIVAAAREKRSKNDSREKFPGLKYLK